MENSESQSWKIKCNGCFYTNYIEQITAGF